MAKARKMLEMTINVKSNELFLDPIKKMNSRHIEPNLLLEFNLGESQINFISKNYNSERSILKILRMKNLDFMSVDNPDTKISKIHIGIYDIAKFIKLISLLGNEYDMKLYGFVISDNIFEVDKIVAKNNRMVLDFRCVEGKIFNNDTLKDDLIKNLINVSDKRFSFEYDSSKLKELFELIKIDENSNMLEIISEKGKLIFKGTDWSYNVTNEMNIDMELNSDHKITIVKKGLELIDEDKAMIYSLDTHIFIKSESGQSLLILSGQEEDI